LSITETIPNCGINSPARRGFSAAIPLRIPLRIPLLRNTDQTP
jgi:hypothetical protein